MKSFLLLLLLLVLSFITGREASPEVKGCIDGWIEFTCPNSDPKKPKSIDVFRPKQKPIHITAGKEWENNEKLYVYHDELTKNLMVVVNKLEAGDFGDYGCKTGKKKTQELDLEKEKRGCQSKLFQTVRATATTNFTCDRTETSSFMFLCKKDGFKCTEILWTVSSEVSEDRFTITVSKRVFTIEIRQVSADDAGVYWCGQRSPDRYQRAARKEIQLEVQDLPTDTITAAIGQTLTYSCQYEGSVPITKLVCKGEQSSTCQQLQTATNERFSIKDDRIKQNITITLRRLTRDDTGIYWCGAKNTHPRRSDPFFHKLVLTVESPPSSTPSIHPRTQPSSTPYSTSTTASVKSQDIPRLIGVAAAVTCAAALVLLGLVLICRRVEGSKNTADDGAQNEDHYYAEIQELPLTSDSGTAPKPVYASASFPLSPLAPYSVVQLPNISGGGCSAATPAFSAVDEPSTLADSALYYTVNNPQQQ